MCVGLAELRLTSSGYPYCSCYVYYGEASRSPKASGTPGAAELTARHGRGVVTITDRRPAGGSGEEGPVRRVRRGDRIARTPPRHPRLALRGTHPRRDGGRARPPAAGLARGGARGRRARGLRVRGPPPERGGRRQPVRHHQIAHRRRRGRQRHPRRRAGHEPALPRGHAQPRRDGEDAAERLRREPRGGGQQGVLRDGSRCARRAPRRRCRGSPPRSSGARPPARRAPRARGASDPGPRPAPAARPQSRTGATTTWPR